MEYTKLGSTGLDVSKLCFGTWRFNSQADDGTVETNREDAHELLDAFVEHGGNFIDTANGYGGGKSEKWIGEWLEERDREEYVIASKVYWTQVSRVDRNLSRKTIRAEIEGTLDRLDREGFDRVEVDVEFSTAGDARVCPICAGLQGNTYTISEARGRVPQHPGCRCAFLPVVDSSG